MTVETLLKAVDAEIAKWNRVRAAIEHIFNVMKSTPKPRRVKPVATRHLSKAGRAAIAAAAKRRWARVRAAKKAKAAKK